MRKLSDQEIDNLRSLRKKGYSGSELSKLFNCATSTVYLWLEEDDAIRKEKMPHRVNTHTCLKCGMSYKEHKRCEICTRLLHGEDKCCQMTSCQVDFIVYY